jgi:predicted membrane channel-forming protein YqfA (hemolysin III family)
MRWGLGIMEIIAKLGDRQAQRWAVIVSFIILATVGASAALSAQ